MNKLILSISFIIIAAFIRTSDCASCIVQPTVAASLSGSVTVCTAGTNMPTGSTFAACFVTYTNSSSGAGYTAGCANSAAAAAGSGYAASPACASTSTIISGTSSGTLTNSVCLADQATGGLTATQLQATVSTSSAVTSCYVQSAVQTTSTGYYTSSTCTGTNLFCSISQTFVSTGVWSYQGACAGTCTALSAPTSAGTAVTTCCSTNNCNVPNALSSTTTTTTTTTVKSSANIMSFTKYFSYLLVIVAVLLN